MKSVSFLSLIYVSFAMNIWAQGTKNIDAREKDVYSLIDAYVQARENKDSLLLTSILTSDVDQLVSSGTWRIGKNESMKGMLQSSARNPGTRRIIVERIRFLDAQTGIVDARYEIKNPDGTERKMWSTFMVVHDEDRWKITAIRNMLPAGPQ